MPTGSGKRPSVLVFFGMVAAGKSYLASEWASLHGCACYNTDVVRKELAGLAPESRQSSAMGQGIYNREFSRRTYDELTARAEKSLDLQAGCVVLDGSYHEAQERRRLVKVLADRCSLYFVYCYCSETCILERLERRASDPNAVSDGRWEIYQAQKATFQVPENVSGARLLKLRTEQAVEDLIAAVDAFVGCKTS